MFAVINLAKLPLKLAEGRLSAAHEILSTDSKFSVRKSSNTFG